ncbi:MAG: nicotinate phosphoribosyltransferase [Acidobacteria bacterium]|nr:nicotinate phosphoribosyltransferase [Acidobacteriota bacterium]
MHGLLTDLYQLTMAAGYVAAGKSGERATFELFVRRLPGRRDYLVAAGLQQAVEYLRGLSFTAEEIAYLRGLPQFSHAPGELWQVLRDLRFTGDLWALPEGTPFLAGEPVLTVRAPLIEAQIAETYLLSVIGFQTMIASKAARVVKAAEGRPVVEFGTRRAHSPEAGVLAARAAYVGGCMATSNVEAGMRFGVPVTGTAAHSWVQSFASEEESFRRLQDLYGERTVYLIDTYDTEQGARRAAALGRPLWGVRLDSGDLDALSRRVRVILDEARLREAKIMASGDLNEDRIRDLVAAGAPVDAFGVGTELSTSSDTPTLSVVYKLVEIDGRPVAKFSPGKQTYPGSKQVFRFPDRDMVSLASDCPCDEVPQPVPLLRPVMLGGELAGPLAALEESRGRAREKPPSRVEYSDSLKQLLEQCRPSSST